MFEIRSTTTASRARVAGLIVAKRSKMMPFPLPDDKVRLPRHCAAEESRTQIQVQRQPGQKPQNIAAELVDLSRRGGQFVCSTSLEMDEPIVLHIMLPSSSLEVRLSAKVRWERPASDGLFAVGCILDDEMDWETLGEMFLNGVLSADLPTS